MSYKPHDQNAVLVWKTFLFCKLASRNLVQIIVQGIIFEKIVQIKSLYEKLFSLRRSLHKIYLTWTIVQGNGTTSEQIDDQLLQ